MELQTTVVRAVLDAYRDNEETLQKLVKIIRKGESRRANLDISAPALTLSSLPKGTFPGDPTFGNVNRLLSMADEIKELRKLRDLREAFSSQTRMALCMSRDREVLEARYIRLVPWKDIISRIYRCSSAQASRKFNHSIEELCNSRHMEDAVIAFRELQNALRALLQDAA